MRKGGVPNEKRAFPGKKGRGPKKLAGTATEQTAEEKATGNKMTCLEALLQCFPNGIQKSTV